MWRTRWCEGSTQDVTPKAQPSEYLLNPYRLNWWETVPSNTLYQSQHRKIPSMNQNSLFHKREVRRRLSFRRQWWQWQQRRHRGRRPHSDSRALALARTWLNRFQPDLGSNICKPNYNTEFWYGKAWRGRVNRLRLCVFTLGYDSCKPNYNWEFCWQSLERVRESASSLCLHLKETLINPNYLEHHLWVEW